MKKLQLHTFILLATLLSGVATSCSREHVVDNSEIVFTSTLDTKVSSGMFEVGDNISLWAVEHTSADEPLLLIGGNFLNSESFVYDGSVWRGERPVYWSSVPCDFYALYPRQGQLESVTEHPFSLVLDQNALNSKELTGYEQSDLLYARVDDVAHTSESVRLPFHHLMSRCVVKLVEGPMFSGTIPDDVTVRVYNTVTDAIIDMRQGTASRDSYGYKRTITMHKLSSKEFEAIIIPQRIENRTPLIEITMGGISYLLEYGLSFKPGYTQTINVTLNTSPDQENIEISIDPEIRNR